MAQNLEFIKSQFVEISIEGKDRNGASAPLFNVDGQSSDSGVAGFTGGRVEGNKTILTLTAFNAGTAVVTITSNDQATGGQTFTETINVTVTEELAVLMEVVIGEPQDQ